MKKCTVCQTTRPLEEFAKSGLWNGTQLYKAVCKPCTNSSMRAGRRNAVRVHRENATQERSPHGKGIVKVSVPGWGYAAEVRGVSDDRTGGAGDRAVLVRRGQNPVAVLTDDGSGLSGSAV